MFFNVNFFLFYFNLIKEKLVYVKNRIFFLNLICIMYIFKWKVIDILDVKCDVLFLDVNNDILY